MDRRNEEKARKLSPNREFGPIKLCDLTLGANKALQYDEDGDLYWIDCDAHPAELEITIGPNTYYVEPVNMMIRVFFVQIWSIS